MPILPEDEDEDDVEMIRPRAREVCYDTAFEITGTGHFNHVVLITCGLIMMNVSMESIGISYVTTPAERDLKLSSHDKGLINAAAFIGIVSTSFIWGYLGDRYGRRAVMLPALVLSSIVSMASAFSPDMWTLFSLRTLTGCLVSASSATVYAYLGEMYNKRWRGTAISWGSMFISISFIILPGTAWIILPGTVTQPLGIVSWRVYIITWCIPGLLAAFLLFFLPESPKFVLATQGPEKALIILKAIYCYNRYIKNPERKYPILAIRTTNEDKPLYRGFIGAFRSVLQIFKPPLLRCVIISHISMFSVFMLSSGIYMWFPEILNVAIQGKDQSNTLCDNFQEMIKVRKYFPLSHVVYPLSMAMGIIFTLTYLIIGRALLKFRAKSLYCFVMSFCGISTAFASFSPHVLPGIGLIMLGLNSGCAASVLAAISVDVFPTSLRAMAMCILYMSGRAGAAVGANILGTMMETHCKAVIAFVGIFAAGSTLLMIFWPQPEKVREEMETKGFTY